MDNHNSKIKMDNNKQQDDFQLLWERRKYSWQEMEAKAVPNDETILRMADHASRQDVTSEAAIFPFNSRHRQRWIPYVAAASLVTGVALVSLNRQKSINNPTPQVQTVEVEGHTMFFMCNNGCSVQDIIYAANDVIDH